MTALFTISMSVLLYILLAKLLSKFERKTAGIESFDDNPALTMGIMIMRSIPILPAESNFLSNAASFPSKPLNLKSTDSLRALNLKSTDSLSAFISDLIDTISSDVAY
jgi:hypothetical protein